MSNISASCLIPSQTDGKQSHKGLAVSKFINQWSQHELSQSTILYLEWLEGMSVTSMEKSQVEIIEALQLIPISDLKAVIVEFRQKESFLPHLFNKCLLN